MALSSHPITDDLRYQVTTASAGDTITPIAAGNELFVTVDTNAATTRTETINSVAVDFVEVTLASPTEIGQVVEIGVDGAEHLWVNAAIKYDSAPLGTAIERDPTGIRTVRYFANSLTEWTSSDSTGETGPQGPSGTATSAPWQTDNYTLTLNQASVTLSQAPTDPNSIRVDISGAPDLNAGTDFNLAGTSVTFVPAVAAIIQAGDRLTVSYQ